MEMAEYSLENCEYKFADLSRNELLLIQAFNWSKSNFREIHIS